MTKALAQAQLSSKIDHLRSLMHLQHRDTLDNPLTCYHSPWHLPNGLRHLFCMACTPHFLFHSNSPKLHSLFMALHIYIKDTPSLSIAMAAEEPAKEEATPAEALPPTTCLRAQNIPIFEEKPKWTLQTRQVRALLEVGPVSGGRSQGDWWTLILRPSLNFCSCLEQILSPPTSFQIMHSNQSWHKVTWTILNLSIFPGKEPFKSETAPLLLSATEKDITEASTQYHRNAIFPSFQALTDARQQFYTSAVYESLYSQLKFSLH